MTRPNGHAAHTATPMHQTTEPQADLLERVVEATRYSVRDVETMAKRAAASRMFSMDENQAFALMMICESEGLHPAQALKRYYIIQGRPAMRADAMQAEFQRIGGRLRWLKTTDEECEAVFSHPIHCPEGQTSRFTLADAKRAGLAGKDTWAKYPAAMLRARVISAGIRMVTPGVVAGIYTPEEVSDFDEPRAAPRPLAPMQWDPAAPAAHIEVPAPVAQSPPRGECSAWIQSQIDDVENEWASICGKAKVPHHHLGRAGKRLTVWELVNGLISAWIEEDVLPPEAVEIDGKRDRAKTMEVIKVEWQNDREAFCQDILGRLQIKLQAAAQAAGINLDIEPIEETATA